MVVRHLSAGQTNKLLCSDGTIYRIVSNIAILRSYRGISLLKRSRYSAQLWVAVAVNAVYAVGDIDMESRAA